MKTVLNVLAALALLAALAIGVWLLILPCTPSSPRLAIGDVIQIGGCK